MIHYAVAASELTDGFQRYKLPQQDGNSLNGIRLSLTGFCSERRTAYIGNELAGVSNGIRNKVSGLSKFNLNCGRLRLFRVKMSIERFVYTVLISN